MWCTVKCSTCANCAAHILIFICSCPVIEPYTVEMRCDFVQASMIRSPTQKAGEIYFSTKLRPNNAFCRAADGWSKPFELQWPHWTQHYLWLCNIINKCDVFFCCMSLFCHQLLLVTITFRNFNVVIPRKGWAGHPSAVVQQNKSINRHNKRHQCQATCKKHNTHRFVLLIFKWWSHSISYRRLLGRCVCCVCNVHTWPMQTHSARLHETAVRAWTIVDVSHWLLLFVQCKSKPQITVIRIFYDNLNE